jgi:purine-binding chemotaxis protein CheW
MEGRFLLFSAAAQGFAFNLQEISEVMEPLASFPIPGAPEHFTGLINFHGTLTALVDLGRYLGLGPECTPGKVLVLDTKLAQLALGVDEVRAIIAAETVTGETASDDPLTVSVLETAYGNFRLLRLDTLLFGLEQGLSHPNPDRRS